MADANSPYEPVDSDDGFALELGGDPGDGLAHAFSPLHDEREVWVGTRNGVVFKQDGIWTFRAKLASGDWWSSPESFDTEDDAIRALGEVLAPYPRLTGFIIEPPSPREQVETVSDSVRLDIEAFVSEWSKSASVLHLDADGRRIGDALVRMASEMAKAKEPPASVLRSAFQWFAHKLDVASEEAAKVVGKGAGATIVAGGVAASGQLPRLVELAGRVLSGLG